MPLLDIVDNADLTRLQRFVQATTLIPGDDAGISARDLNGLAKAVKAFAEGGSRKHAKGAMARLRKAYEGTPYADEIDARTGAITRRWAFQARKAGEES